MENGRETQCGINRMHSISEVTLKRHIDGNIESIILLANFFHLKSLKRDVHTLDQILIYSSLVQTESCFFLSIRIVLLRATELKAAVAVYLNE